MPDNIRVRFAPSPTGFLHIGGVRTALFNWLFARHNNGVFILRIEDTDQSRSTEESINAITDGMQWLGLDWDEGPYRQTERMDIYKQYVNKLLEEGKAYYCYCTPEELEGRRKRALAEKRIPKYDGRCRGLKAPITGREAAIRFKAPHDGETIVDDLVKGRVVFDNAQMDDLIIMRSDGWPTYNLCVVVDDATMGITHVIRGDDHLNNTPRQIQLYNALCCSIPQFAHLPMILGHDRTRLSKRHGATSVIAYKDMGYLPEAVVNYLVRLGWSYKDQEVFNRGELIEKFTLEHVGKAAAVFNPEKLLWMNSHYIAHMETKDIIKCLKPFLIKEGLIKTSDEPPPPQLGKTGVGEGEAQLNEVWMTKVIISLRERCRTLTEFASAARYFFLEDVETDPEAAKKFLIPQNRPALEDVLKGIEALPVLSENDVDTLFKSIMANKSLKMGQVAQPVRVALTGRTVSPGIFEVIDILGREKVVRRLRRTIDVIPPV
ncbi:MAG: glutamate--tRNA ligase [Nitrospirae bacterium]|nr:glutamate--tRNA ligase [Nitrospirota bacterium]